MSSTASVAGETTKRDTDGPAIAERARLVERWARRARIGAGLLRSGRLPGTGPAFGERPLRLEFAARGLRIVGGPLRPGIAGTEKNKRSQSTI